MRTQAIAGFATVALTLADGPTEQPVLVREGCG